MVTNFRNWRIGIAGLFVGVALTGWLVRGESQVQAEVRRPTPTQPEQHFKSGGRLSEGVLQEILVVLKRMDDRLARIESASQSPRIGTLQATPSSDSGPTTNQERDVPEIKLRRAK
jgi:hypothetical protein